MTGRDLGPLRWPELTERAARSVLAIPLGATEQHGPHLPLHTDTTIAVELCRRLAERVPSVLVAPPVPYGSSGEHAGFPGTLSIGRSALKLLLVELARSADDFGGLVFVSGHGGNVEPLREAVRVLRSEGRRVLAWLPSGAADDSHAGRAETSALLRLTPEEVLLDHARRGSTEPLPDIIDRLREGGIAAVSPSGVLGDPTGADAAEGEEILTRWAETLAERVRTWLEQPR